MTIITTTKRFRLFKKLCAIFVAVFIMLSTVPIFADYAPSFSGGSGSAIDPFILATADDLISLSVLYNDYYSEYTSKYSQKYYSITKDIDLSDSEETWRPLGSHKANKIFSGYIQGNGNTITLKDNIFSSYFMGIIENLTINGNIELNLTSGADNYIYGAFVGYNIGTLKNCVFDGKLTVNTSNTTDPNVGAITGMNCGQIINCHSSSNTSVTTSSSSGLAVGGITGSMQHSVTSARNIPSIINSYSRAKVEGNAERTANVGGIVGSLFSRADAEGYYVTIENCYFAGELKATSNLYKAGGERKGSICAYKGKNGVEDALIKNCYSISDYAILAVKGPESGYAQNCAFVDFSTGLLTPSSVNVDNDSSAYFNQDGSTMIVNALNSYVEDNMNNGYKTWQSKDNYPYFSDVNFSSLTIKNNDLVTSDYFVTGDLSVEAEIDTINNDAIPAVIVAQYDETNNGLITAAISQYDAQQNIYSANLNITKTENTYIKIFSFASIDTLMPALNPQYLYPYPKDNIINTLKIFPSGSTKALVMSYDDGYASSNDKDFFDILKDSSIKVTYNLVSSWLNTDEKINAAKELYNENNVEISNHSKNHPYMDVANATAKGQPIMTIEECEKEISDGKQDLESYFDTTVDGFAFPFATPYDQSFYDDLIKYMHDNLGIKYARPTITSGNFDVPTNWMDWRMTCHHRDMMKYSDSFINSSDDGKFKVFSIWGHTNEFELAGDDDNLNWNFLRSFVNKMKTHDEVWYAGCSELYNYITASDELSINNNYVVNPTDIDLYIRINGKNCKIPANSMLNYATKQISDYDSEAEERIQLLSKVKSLPNATQAIPTIISNTNYDEATKPENWTLSRVASVSDVTFDLHTPDTSDVNQTQMVRATYTPTFTTDEQGKVTYTKDTYPYLQYQLPIAPVYKDANGYFQSDAAKMHFTVKVRKNTSGSALQMMATYYNTANSGKGDIFATLTEEDKIAASGSSMTLDTNTTDFYKVDYYVDFKTGERKIYVNDTLFSSSPTLAASEITSRNEIRFVRFAMNQETSSKTYDFDDVKCEVYPEQMSLEDVYNYVNGNTKVTAIDAENNGIECNEDFYSAGEFSSKIGFSSTEAEKLTMLLVLSDANGNIIDVVKSTDVSNNSLSAKLNNVNADNTKIKAYLVENFDGEDQKVLYMKEYSAYSDKEIQSISQLFPTQSTKALTLSYDDGRAQDTALMGILNKYGLKATINLIGYDLFRLNSEKRAITIDLYKGHEITNHGYNHLNVSQTVEENGEKKYKYSIDECKNDIKNCQDIIQEIFGTTSLGFAYPGGASFYSRTDGKELVDYADSLGIKYARTVSSNGSFNVPDDWMKWNPTCSHASVSSEITDKFLDTPDSGNFKIYYVWGHSWEMDSSVSSTDIEDFSKKMADHTEVWKATNGEIYNYVTAYKKLSVDKNCVTNNSDIPLYIRINGHNFCIKAGESLDYGNR